MCRGYSTDRPHPAAPLEDAALPKLNEAATAHSLFPDHLVFVRPDQREPGPVIRGQVREKSCAADGIWVGYCDITTRDEPGEWHHHADYDSTM